MTIRMSKEAFGVEILARATPAQLETLGKMIRMGWEVTTIYGPKIGCAMPKSKGGAKGWVEADGKLSRV